MSYNVLVLTVNSNADKDTSTDAISNQKFVSFAIYVMTPTIFEE